jgi:hypothetical protein
MRRARRVRTEVREWSRRRLAVLSGQAALELREGATSVRRDRRRQRFGEEDGPAVGRIGDVCAPLVPAAACRAVAASIVAAATSSFTVVAARRAVVAFVAARWAVAIFPTLWAFAPLALPWSTVLVFAATFGVVVTSGPAVVAPRDARHRGRGGTSCLGVAEPRA